jgi:hypothetical protein
MSSKDLLSASLIELSDAIEQLAHIIAQQGERDQDIHIKQFSLIVKKFKDTTSEAQKALGQPEIPPVSSKAALIKASHKKGYLKNWLEERGLQVVDSSSSLQVDDYLFGAVDFLADHYQHLVEFYKQLKRHQSIKKNFTHYTAKNSINYIMKWCEMLKQHQLIDAFTVSHESEVFVDIAEIHSAAQFIYGYWLEVLLRKEVAQVLNDHITDIHSFDVLSQINIVKPNEQFTEFDLMLMLNDEVYWFECKSGVIQNYFKKFAEHRQLMKLTEKNAFLVIPGRMPGIAAHTLKRAGMTTLYGTELEHKLKEILFP